MAGWTKMKLGMEVGLSRSHIVLDGDASQFLAHVLGAKLLDGLRCQLPP